MEIDGHAALIDANVLAYAAGELAPQRDACRELLERAGAGKVALCIAPQVLYEYYATMTNRKITTPTLTVEEAIADIVAFQALFPMIVPTAEHPAMTAAIVRQAGLLARDVFDATLAATMLGNGITRIYTCNVRHFRRIEGITVLTP